jgi:uridine kinase
LTSIFIGISGPSGSGKSLLSSKIACEFPSSLVTLISEDSYYKDQKNIPEIERDKINDDSPKAFDHNLFLEHLNKLKCGESINAPIYDFNTHTRNNEKKRINSTKIILIEGILIFFHREIRDILDIRIYVDTPLDLCLIRRMNRDIKERGRSSESILLQYKKHVRPSFLKNIKPYKKYAHIIVPRGGKNSVALAMIKSKLKDMLKTIF